LRFLLLEIQETEFSKQDVQELQHKQKSRNLKH